MKIKLITEPDLIVSTVNTEGIIEHVFEDGTALNLATIKSLVANNEAARFIGLYDDEYLGMFMFHRCGQVSWDVHACLFKGDKRAYLGAYQAHQWLFSNTGCRKICASIPVDLPHVKLFALKLGFRNEGINTNSFLRNQHVISQWRLGLQKEHLKCPLAM